MSKETVDNLAAQRLYLTGSMKIDRPAWTKVTLIATLDDWALGAWCAAGGKAEDWPGRTKP